MNLMVKQVKPFSEFVYNGIDFKTETKLVISANHHSC